MSPSSTRAQTDGTTLTFTLGRCDATSCSYDLVLNVATGDAPTAATTQIPFTMTQSAGPAVILGQTTYTIPANANPSASVDFGSHVEFRSDITHWWITGRNGSAIPVSASISVTGGSRVPVTTKSFTMNVPLNPNIDSRELYQLEIHVERNSSGSQGSVAFTVMQAGKVTGLNQTSLSVPKEAGTNSDVMLKVEAGENWTSAITYPTEWNSDVITVSPSMGTGTGSARALTIMYPANTTFADRTAVITFTINSTVLELTITQRVTAVGMIPIHTLEQLDAMRYDLNTDGKVDHKGSLASIADAETAYAAVFPGVEYDENNATKYTGYELVKNLNFTEEASYSDHESHKDGWTGGKGWEPIGTDHSSAFTGMFDGGGYTISNLYINSAVNFAPMGVFGGVNGATIQKVGLVNPYVKGGSSGDIGGLVALLQSGTISNCYVKDGTIEGGSGSGVQGIGGLVGRQNSGTISNCYVSEGSRIGTDLIYVGGLVGYQSGGTISACYVSGGSSIAANGGGVGGLVGIQNNWGTIRACYVSKITATAGDSRRSGSLIGIQQAGSSKLIASYAGGKNYTISLKGSGGGTVTNSYSQTKPVERTTNANPRKPEKTRAALRNPTDYSGIYVNWDDLDGNGTPDTKTYWNFGRSAQYPVLEVDFNNDGNTSDDVTRQRN